MIKLLDAPVSSKSLLPDGLRLFVACATAVGTVLLTACATTPEPKIITRTVNVPIAVKCAAPLTAEPIYSDTPESLRAAPDIFSRVQLLLAGRAQRQARITELTAAISGCVG